MPTTAPTGWTPELITALAAACVAILIALGSVIVGVIGALKGQKAEIKSDVNADRLDRQSARLNESEAFQKSLALQVPPPVAPRDPGQP